MAEGKPRPSPDRWSGYVARSLRRQPRRPPRRDERRTAYFMIFPAVLLIVGIAFFPVIYSLYLSVHAASTTQVGDYVGLGNYILVFQDSAFRVGLVNTTIFTVVSVTLELLLGMGAALGLNQAFRGRGLARAAMLVPWAFPTVISAVMWRLMLQDQVGIISYVARTLGLIDTPILSDRSSLMIASIGVDVWQSTPFMTLLLLAGLQTIPAEVIEAARVDGATAVQRLFRITLPLLKPAMLVAVLFRTLESWSVYDLFWVMGDQQLESLSTYVYKGVRISELQFAPGTAAAVLVFASSIAIALFFIKVLGMQASTEA